ncbi:MAG TPA: pyrimidine 5'-nucleotidase [Ideonella sp.]|nr:pyrimidine 5'-nucleotidase [Ideonella sp.]HSI51122.1 pyrimidine 5'-nucleotidase [Ideonella sp.]
MKAVRRVARLREGERVWLFDLDNTLHNASASAFRGINERMGAYMTRELGLEAGEAHRLRQLYWQRYGATLLGLVRHHGVNAGHFLQDTHVLPGLEQQLQTHAHDVAALQRLRGPRLVLTNAPLAYAERVLGALGLRGLFDGVIAIEQMAMFGQLRPKPDTRMLQALVARLGVPAHRCVLVEDTLAHQKAAHSLGMRTVWMQRWLRAAHTPPEPKNWRRRPPYVYARIRSLQQLRSVL